MSADMDALFKRHPTPWRMVNPVRQTGWAYVLDARGDVIEGGVALVEDVARLLASAPAMREALEAIRDYPRKGEPRRTKDGYPAEVCYDEFAYKRIVDSYRDIARAGLNLPATRATEET